MISFDPYNRPCQVWLYLHLHLIDMEIEAQG